MVKRLAALIICLAAFPVLGQTAPNPCGKGDYRSIDGRCLHDQTGEHHPAGDGCNVATCMDPACHSQSVTAMACLHGDDPVTSIVPGGENGATQTTTINTTVSTGTFAPISPPQDIFINTPESSPSCPKNPAYKADGRCFVILRFADVFGPINVVCVKRPKLDSGWVVFDCSWKPAKPTGVSCVPSSTCTFSAPPKKEKAKP